MVKIDAEGTAYNASCFMNSDDEFDHGFEFFEGEHAEDLPSVPGVHPFALSLLMQTLKNTVHPDVFGYPVKLDKDIMPTLFRPLIGDACEVYVETENLVPTLSLTVSNDTITDWAFVNVPTGEYMLATDQMLDEWEGLVSMPWDSEPTDYDLLDRYNEYQNWLRECVRELRASGNLHELDELYIQYKEMRDALLV